MSHWMWHEDANLVGEELHTPCKDTPFWLSHAMWEHRKNPRPSSHLLGLGVIGILTQQSPLLGLLAFLSPLTGSLGLRTAGVHLFLQDSLTLLLGLSLVDLHDISKVSRKT